MPQHPLEIVLLEDNPGDVFLVEQALRQHALPYRLRVLNDGEAAENYIDTLGKTPEVPCPDIILMDLNVPKVTGTEVLARFRAHKECETTPIIIMSASQSPRDWANVSQLGADRFFKKGIDLDDFLQLGSVIREMVATRGQA